jgi:hypothetical protein
MTQLSSEISEILQAEIKSKDELFGVFQELGFPLKK